jgi:hypothetical protein
MGVRAAGFETDADRCGPQLRAFLLQRRVHRAIAVPVKAAAGFTAKEAGVDQFLLQHGGGETRVAKKCIEHGLRHRKIHVVADQVHQLEWPHAKAAAVAHHGVERDGISGLFR